MHLDKLSTDNPPNILCKIWQLRLFAIYKPFGEVDGIGLAALHIRLTDIGGINRIVKAKLGDFARPVVTRCTGLYANNAGMTR